MVLTTARLVLEPQKQADAKALFAILGDAEAMCFWSRPAISRLAVVEDLLREQQAAMAEGICRYWTVIQDGDRIGSIDLSLIRDGSAELGFLLRRDCWGQGLATEAVEAVVHHGFSALELARLAAAVQTANHAAARVLEKNGFALISARPTIIVDGQTKDCAFYLRNA